MQRCLGGSQVGSEQCAAKCVPLGPLLGRAARRLKLCLLLPGTAPLILQCLHCLGRESLLLGERFLSDLPDVRVRCRKRRLRLLDVRLLLVHRLYETLLKLGSPVLPLLALQLELLEALLLLVVHLLLRVLQGRRRGRQTRRQLLHLLLGRTAMGVEVSRLLEGKRLFGLLVLELLFKVAHVDRRQCVESSQVGLVLRLDLGQRLCEVALRNGALLAHCLDVDLLLPRHMCLSARGMRRGSGKLRCQVGNRLLELRSVLLVRSEPRGLMLQSLLLERLISGTLLLLQCML